MTDKILNDQIISTINNFKNTNIQEQEQKIDIPIGKNPPENENNIKTKSYSYNYRLGNREHNTRIIGCESISTRIGSSYISSGLNPLVQYAQIIQNHNGIANPDNYFDTSNQGKRGDCYLLAEINGIRNTKNGQQILKQNIKTNPNGSITVTLPGAIKFRNECIKNGQGDKCEVTGTYYITKDALEKAKKYAGKSYSKGDIEIIALEIAIENFRAEMALTNKNLGNNNTRIGTLENSANTSGIRTGQDYLSGGQGFDAVFLLTGQKSDVYLNTNKKTQQYKDGQYGYITVEEMERRTGFDSGYNSKAMSTVEGRISSNNSKLDQMLNKYANQEDKHSLVAYVKTKGGGHAVTIVKITDNIIYVSNPWHPDKIEPIPRKEFEKIAYGFMATDIDSRDITHNHISNNIQQLINSEVPHKPLKNNDVEALQSILNKMNFNQRTNNKPVKISSNKLQELISAYNNNQKENHTINSNDFLRIINNMSKSNINLSSNEKEKLNIILNKLSNTSNKSFENEDIEFLKTISHKYNN